MKRHEGVWREVLLIVSSLFLLLFMIWLPLSALTTRGITAMHRHGSVIIQHIQETPTVDSTTTALEKEKLVHENDWLWNNGATLFSTLALFIAGIFGIVRWFGDRQAEREKQQGAENHRREDQLIERKKQDEVRFQSVVEGLGSEKREARVGAAIMLRTFLRSEYEEFYSQAFDLAVANLRLRNADSNIPDLLDSLSQALITVFKESFPLARDWLKQSPQFLDAARIQLDNAYLAKADLKKAWMPEAHLRKANLTEANLMGINLTGANLSEISLIGANLMEAELSQSTFIKGRLREANLTEAHLLDANFTESRLVQALFIKANLTRAIFTRADLSKADFTGANLTKAIFIQSTLTKAKLTQVLLIEANLSGADLSSANLTKANLTRANLFQAQVIGADLSGADLKGADLTDVDLTNVNIEKIRSLKNTRMSETCGLTKDQLEICIRKGAVIVREDRVPVLEDLTPADAHKTIVEDIHLHSSLDPQEEHS